ncbi:MAG: flavodoxin family protein [Chloroflexota bacterium]
MRVAIVYESDTGTTRAAAEQMAETVRAAGHECTVGSVEAADPAAVTAADAVCVGSWTKGLFIVAQHPAQATMDFIDRLGSLDGKPVAVFTTYKLAIGGTLKKMAAPLEAHGAKVTGMYKSRGPYAADGFGDWVGALEAGA